MRNAPGEVGAVLLLGGRSEIGLAIVELLRPRRLVLGVRGGESAESVAGVPEVHVVEFDAARPESHAAVVERAAALAGDLDVIIPAFGVLGSQRAYDADPAAAAAAAMVNYGGHVSVGLAAAARLRAQGHGALVVLSSVAGARVRRANFVYGSAKAGLDGFAQGLGDALHGSGAHVMIVRPGFVVGRMTAGLRPAPLASTPARVAAATVAGLRRGARVVWVPGALRWFFALLRLLPQPLWRRLPR